MKAKATQQAAMDDLRTHIADMVKAMKPFLEKYEKYAIKQKLPLGDAMYLVAEGTQQAMAHGGCYVDIPEEVKVLLKRLDN